jgi:cytochrome c-type biogenesis protein CcmH
MDAATADARRALANDALKLTQFEALLKNLDSEPAVAATAPPPVAPAEPAPEQDPMIRGMVERLAARLSQDGSDVNGWIMLTRSYLVLGDRARAEATVTAARTAIGDNAESRRQLDDGLKGLGF